MLTSSCVKCWVEWSCKVHYKYLKDVYILVLQYIVISISLPYSSFSLFSLSLSFFSLAFSVIILSYYLKVCLTIFWFIVFSFFLSSLFLSHSLNFSLIYFTFSLCLLSLSLFLSHIIRICLADCLSACLCVSLFQCIYRLAVCISPLKFF